MANETLRKEITRAGLHHWQVAEKYGVSDSYFSCKLRRELPEEEKERIRKIIAELKGA